MDQRYIELLAEFADNLLAVSEYYSSACTDERFFRLIKKVDYSAKLYRVDLYLRLVPADDHLSRIMELLSQLGLLNVHRDVDQDRSLAPRGCDIERFLEHPRDIVRILDQITVLYE